MSGNGWLVVLGPIQLFKHHQPLVGLEAVPSVPTAETPTRTLQAG